MVHREGKMLNMEKYLDLRREKEYEEIEEAGKIIKNGGLVLFPT